MILPRQRGISISEFVPSPLHFHAPSTPSPTPSAIDRERERDRSLQQLLPLMQLSNVCHQQWCQLKKQSGWKFGASFDESQMLHPDLVPFKQLTESSHHSNLRRRELWNRCVLNTMACLVAMGFNLSPPPSSNNSSSSATAALRVNFSPQLLQVFDVLCENFHETWCENRLQSGWKHPISASLPANSPKSAASQCNPLLGPFNELPASTRDQIRATVQKMLLTLLTECAWVIRPPVFAVPLPWQLVIPQPDQSAAGSSPAAAPSVSQNSSSNTNTGTLNSLRAVFRPKPASTPFNTMSQPASPTPAAASPASPSSDSEGAVTPPASPPPAPASPQPAQNSKFKSLLSRFR